MFFGVTHDHFLFVSPSTSTVLSISTFLSAGTSNFLSRNLEISWSTTSGIKEHKLGSGIEEYKSALFKHTRSTGHKIDYNSPVILDKASNHNKLLLKEMLHINRLKPTLNKQKKSALFNMIIGT